MNFRKTISILILAPLVISGFIFLSGNQVQAITIADRNGIQSSCPHKYPNNTGHCNIAINSITVNGFTDNDPNNHQEVPYGYITGGQTVSIQWTKQGPDPYYYEVRFGCGNSLDFSQDNHWITDTTQYSSPYSTYWNIPSWVNNYKYCKVWIYAKDNDPFVNTDHPTLGVSNTRPFAIHPKPTPQPTVTLTAYPSTINVGNSSVLSWTSTNATSCVASGGWSGNKNTNGSQTVNPTQTTTYLINCTGAGGSASASATVYVNQPTPQPTVTFWADRYSLTKGESTYLRWTSTNSSYCVASNGWSGTKSTSSYEATTPTQTTTYTISCYGNNGHSTKSLTIYVNDEGKNISLLELGRNLSRGERIYKKVIRVSEGDIIEFYITVTAGPNKDLSNVVLKDSISSPLKYILGSTKIDGVNQPDTINTTGLLLGTIPRGTSKIVTFQVSSKTSTTYLTYTNTATVLADSESPAQDSASIVYSLVAGASTIKTGASDSFLIIFFISLALSLFSWYYLKFTPQGQLAFANFENKLRERKLNSLRNKITKNY